MARQPIDGDVRPSDCLIGLGPRCLPEPKWATSGSATSKWSRSPGAGVRGRDRDHGRTDLGMADTEVARLFRVIADLHKAGATVIYISHKMNEIFALATKSSCCTTGSSSPVPRAVSYRRDRSSATWLAGKSRRLTTCNTRSSNGQSSRSRTLAAQPAGQRPA